MGQFRQEIHGLRALAVMLVVVFHVWPEVLPGGFVGVDVFFVISGFLITGQLLREHSDTGSVDLARFWQRRIRRLLPAASLVLCACVLLTVSFLPKALWKQTVSEIIASAFYVQNWWLGFEQVSYFAVENQPTMVQHYWSLSIEEQFYLLWPIILIASFRFFRRGNGAAAQTQVFFWAALAVLVLSLAYSVAATANSPGLAYFSTGTRAWEFALGALLHALPRVSSAEGRYRSVPFVTTWFGIGLIVFSAISFSGSTPFPGVIALIPVAGTALVIWSGSQPGAWSWSSISSLGLIRFLGNTSYSGYLWHWPIIVVFPFVFHRNYEPLEGVAIVATTFLLAWLTLIFVENPLRQKKVGPGRMVPVFGLAAVAMLVPTVGGILAQQYVRRQLEAVPFLDRPYSVVSDIQHDLGVTLEKRAWPLTDQSAGKDALPSEWVVDGCLNVLSKAKRETCQYGNASSDRKLALIGDSWAIHLLPAIREAYGEDWKILVLTLGQCPLADVSVHTWSETAEFERCEEHRGRVLDMLRTAEPELVIAADSSISAYQRLMSKNVDEEGLAEMREGTVSFYSELVKVDFPLVVVESPPRANCMIQNHAVPNKCEPTKDTQFERKLALMKVDAAENAGLPFLDLTFWVCSNDLVCPQQIGNHLVKADGGHFSESFSRRLGPVLQQAIEVKLQ